MPTAETHVFCLHFPGSVASQAANKDILVQWLSRPHPSRFYSHLVSAAQISLVVVVGVAASKPAKFKDFAGDRYEQTAVGTVSLINTIDVLLTYSRHLCSDVELKGINGKTA
jgi:hypothetical protein